MIAHLAVKLSIPTYLAIIANNVSYKHNVVQYYVTKKRSELHFDLFEMFRDGCDIDGFCTKSENSDWKHM